MTSRRKSRPGKIRGFRPAAVFVDETADQEELHPFEPSDGTGVVPANPDVCGVCGRHWTDTVHEAGSG